MKDTNDPFETRLAGLKGIISILLVQQAMAEISGFSLEELRGKKLSQKLSEFRHIAISLCVEYDFAAKGTIGDLFGGRGHGTVAGIYRKISRLRRTEKWPSLKIYRRCRGKLERRLRRFDRREKAPY